MFDAEMRERTLGQTAECMRMYSWECSGRSFMIWAIRRGVLVAVVWLVDVVVEVGGLEVVVVWAVVWADIVAAWEGLAGEVC